MIYTIAFDFPEGTVYAGDYKGSLGWAPTQKTALLFDTPKDALRMAKNGYGASFEWARVATIPVPE